MSVPDKIGFYSRDFRYGWLSNFYRCDQVVDGVHYPTNEHYYQSQKATGEEFQKWIASAPNPYLAMKAGRTIRAGKPGELRPDWDIKKLSVMLVGLRAKFGIKNPTLQNLLLLTKNSLLYEDSPSDTYWGLVNGTGFNNLGKLLMQVRTEIRQQMLVDLSK